MSCCGGGDDEGLSFEMQKSKKITHMREHIKTVHNSKFTQTGINTTRKCRDIVFLVLFLVFWVGMYVILGIALDRGNVNRIIRPDDSDGNLCGVDNTNDPLLTKGLALKNSKPLDLTLRPYQYFLFPFEIDGLPSSKASRTCVFSCPTKTSLELADAICVPGISIPSIPLLQSGECFLPYASQPLYSRCFPMIEVNNATMSATSSINDSHWLTTIGSTVYIWVLGLGLCLVGAFVICFLWMLVMRFFAGVAIWTSLLSAILFGIVLSIMLFVSATELSDEANSLSSNNTIYFAITNYKILYALAAFSAIFTAISFFGIIFNGRNIMFAITLAEESSKAFVDMPLIILFPVLPAILIGGVTVYCVWVFYYISSAVIPTYDSSGVFQGYQPDTDFMGSLIYHILGYLWTCNFILAINQTVISGAVADWYYSFHGKELNRFPILRSVGRTLIYSLGSLCFGSFYLVLVEIPRVFMATLAYLSSTKPFKNFYCSCCYSTFYQRFIECMNTHVYVMIALYGYPFVTAAKRGHFVVASHNIRVGTIQRISRFVMVVAKFAIAAIVTGSGFLYLYNQENITHLWVVPLIFLALMGYFIASCFMGVYSSSIQTILICFLEDYERNVPEDRHTTKSLEAFLTDHKPTICC